MTLIPTRQGFELAGRFHAVGVPLSTDVATKVREIPHLLALCVSTPDAADIAPTPTDPTIAAPPADQE